MKDDVRAEDQTFIRQPSPLCLDRLYDSCEALLLEGRQLLPSLLNDESLMGVKGLLLKDLSQRESA